MKNEHTLSVGEVWLRDKLGLTAQMKHCRTHQDGEFIIVTLGFGAFETYVIFSVQEVNNWHHVDVTGIQIPHAVKAIRWLIDAWVSDKRPWFFCGVTREAIARDIAHHICLGQGISDNFSESRVLRLITLPVFNNDIVIGRIAIQRYIAIVEGENA